MIATIEPQINFMQIKIEDFASNVENFYKTINRLDEIVSEKSSKSDLEVLNNLLKLTIKRKEFNIYKDKNNDINEKIK